MDIFKQKSYIIFIIILLAILNLGTIFILLIGKPSQLLAKENQMPPGHIEQLLKIELGFDKSQIAQYLKVTRKHHENAEKMENEIQLLEKQMFDEVFHENPQPTFSDSLLKIIQAKQADLEQITFRHFLDLKKLCKPEQQDKLKLLLHEVFHQNAQPRMNKENLPPPYSEGPPPLPPGEEHPPRPVRH